MASLYSNENFPKRVVDELRQLGHDVLTSYEAGRANQKIPDDQVLQFAISRNRAVLTLNRSDFIRLHQDS
jgi:predicted nuclease of predicted toxin-antitoxin system